MKYKIESLITELKKKGRTIYSSSQDSDPEAKVNVWYVIARLEEILLENGNQPRKL